LVDAKVRSAIENIKDNPELLRDLNKALTRIYSSTGVQWMHSDKVDFLEAMINVMKCSDGDWDPSQQTNR
jgi:hypothetical protein